MLGADPKIIRITWSILLLLGFLALTWLLRDLLFLLIVALFFAYVLAPVVNTVERWLPASWNERSAGKEIPLTVVYVVLLAIIASAAAWLGAQIVSQAAKLAEKLPELVANREALLRFPLPGWLEPARAAAIDWVRGFVQGGFNQALPLLKGMAEHLMSGIGSIGLFFMVPIFAFYFVRDGEELAQALLERFPEKARPVVNEIFDDLHHLVAQYMRALVLLSLATFVAYELFFAVTGMPYSILLSALAAVLEFVPVVGPLAASAIIIAMGAFTGYQALVWLIVFLLAYRVFQDYVLQPYLMSSGVELHPFLVLVGVLAGEQMAGTMGLFLAIPAVAGLRIIYLKLEKLDRHN